MPVRVTAYTACRAKNELRPRIIEDSCFTQAKAKSELVDARFMCVRKFNLRSKNNPRLRMLSFGRIIFSPNFKGGSLDLSRNLLSNSSCLNSLQTNGALVLFLGRYISNVLWPEAVCKWEAIFVSIRETFGHAKSKNSASVIRMSIIVRDGVVKQKSF